MQVRFRVHSMIGNIELVYEDDSPGVRQPIARMQIPDESLGELSCESARRAFNNNHMSEAHGNLLREIVDHFVPPVARRLFSVVEFSPGEEHTIAVCWTDKGAARYIADIYLVESRDDEESSEERILANKGFQMDAGTTGWLIREIGLEP